MSKKNNKYNFWKGNPQFGVSGGNESVAALEQELRQNYINKYYNLWLSKFEWDGLDAENASQQKDYIMRKFWSHGSVACRPIENTDLLVFCPWAAATYNLYDYPETISLVNTRGVSSRIIPTATQVVNKDAVIGWAQPNKKPIYMVVKTYIDRMVSIDMVINTNLQLQKMPFLIGVNETDEDKLKDVVRRILNNEVVIFASLEELQRIQTMATQTPYIIDRLQTYQQSLERELMTFLGIDNLGSAATLAQSHINSDQTNAANDEINAYGGSIKEEIETFVNLINKTFGRNISIKEKTAPVASVHKTDMNGGSRNDE